MTLTTKMAAAAGRGRLYLKVAPTDADGTTYTLYWGDASIKDSSGNPVYPVITSWGEFSAQATLDGSGRIKTGEVTLIGGAVSVCSDSSKRMTVSEWLSQVRFSNATAQLYQWNELEPATQTLIWQGVVVEVGDARYSSGEWTHELLFGPSPRLARKAPISDLVTKADFSTAPISSEGSMIPRVWGAASNVLFSGITQNRNSPCWEGFPAPGVQGVVIDSNQATAKIKVRFAKNYGAAANVFAQPTADDPTTAGDLWIYESGTGAYGLVDHNSYSFTNDTSKLEVVVDAAPKVFFFVRPSLKGSQTASGITDLNKLIDEDPTNYSESTTTDYKWAFDCPQVGFPGRVKSVALMIDMGNLHASQTRTVRFGFWDIYPATGAGYLNNSQGAIDAVLVVGDVRKVFITSPRNVSKDFKDHLGSDTDDAFSGGRFLTRDTSDAFEASVQLKAEVVSTNKDQVRVYGMWMAVEVDYPLVPMWNSPSWLGPGFDDWFREHEIATTNYALRKFHERFDFGGRTSLQVRKDALQTIEGTQFFVRGDFRTSTPDTIASDILGYAGEALNTTSGTVGNFTDATASGTILAPLDDLLVQFGPQETSVESALDALTTRLPMRLSKANGSWLCIPDDMNPHSSRNYRSTSDDVWVGPTDVSMADFTVSQLPWDEMRNRVVLKYSHGFPSRPAAANYAYDNPLSRSYFGDFEKLIVEEPMLVQNVLWDPVVGGAQVVAEWYGRRAARPRLLVETTLTQRFFDLLPGHTTEFRGLENAGIVCPAYRNGLLDYLMRSSTLGTNYRDSSAPLFIASSGSGAMYVGMSRQSDQINFLVSVAAVYTPSGNSNGSETWDYSSSSGWTQLTGVTNGNAIKSTGAQTVSWTRPRPDLWWKSEITLNSVNYGPCYWVRMNYSSASNSGTGSGRATMPNVWDGRRFEVIRVARNIGAGGQYPGVRATFQEVM